MAHNTQKISQTSHTVQIITLREKKKQKKTLESVECYRFTDLIL